MLAKYWAPRPTARIPLSLRANEAGIGPASTGSALAGKSGGRSTNASGLGAFAAFAALAPIAARRTPSASTRLIETNDSRGSARATGPDECVDGRCLAVVERDG